MSLRATGLRVIPEHALWIPKPRSFPPDGLVAIGGSMTVSQLLLAYRHGAFPWTVAPVTWWSPDPRALIEFDRFQLPRSLNKVLRRGEFDVSLNRCFLDVMKGCAQGRAAGTWITPEFLSAYAELHHQGYAHSLECWRHGLLAGGLYGVAIGGLFAAESMFHRLANASKVALWHLVRHLFERGFTLLDIQMLTPVTQQLGGVCIPRAEYLARLAKAVQLPCSFVPDQGIP